MSGSLVAGSEELRKANLALLKKRHPSATLALVAGETGESTLGFQPEAGQARTGVPTLTLIGGGRRVPLHSSYDPQAEARQWAAGLPEGNWQVAVLFGFGLGYHAEEVLRRFPNRRLIALEPDPAILAASLTARDLRPLLGNPRFELVANPNEQGAGYAIFERLARSLPTEITLLAWPASARLYGPFWESVQHRVANLLRQKVVNVATNYAFSVQWLINFFTALPTAALDPGIAQLSGRFAGRPAILVAAGPSLEKNIHLLAEAKGRAVIAAAGSAINPLKKQGIEPDLVVSIDPEQSNHAIFAGLDGSNLPLAYSPTIYHQIPLEYNGPRFAMALDVFPFTGWAFRELGDEKGLVASGPSVANSTWDILRLMGCNPIIFVGQDLAYTRNKTHAEGRVDARVIDEGEQAGGRYFYTEDVNGEPVLTDRVMHSMKIWFDQRIESQGQGRLFIDATEGGAKILGTEIMTLREAIDRYCLEEFHPHGEILEVHARERERLAGLGLQQRLGQLFESLEQDLGRVDELAASALKIARPLIQGRVRRQFNPQQYYGAVAAFEELDRKMNTLQVYKQFIRPTVVHVVDVLATISTRRLHEQKDLTRKGEELARIYLTLFQAAVERAAQLRALLRMHGNP